MDDTIKNPGEPNWLASIATQLHRIADAQEQMVMVAMEAREERLKLAAKMTERLQAGFQSEKKNG